MLAQNQQSPFLLVVDCDWLPEGYNDSLLVICSAQRHHFNFLALGLLLLEDLHRIHSSAGNPFGRNTLTHSLSLIFFPLIPPAYLRCCCRLPASAPTNGQICLLWKYYVWRGCWGGWVALAVCSRGFHQCLRNPTVSS